MDKKITFSPIVANDIINKRLHDDLKPINELVAVLKKHNRSCLKADLLQVVADGPDKELNAVMAEVEEYIRATGMPIYLQEDARERARASVDTEFANEIRPILLRWPKVEPKDFSVTEDGTMQFTSHYRDKLIKEYTKELPQHIVALLPRVEKFLEEYKELNQDLNVSLLIERMFKFDTEKTREQFYSHLYDSARRK